MEIWWIEPYRWLISSDSCHCDALHIDRGLRSRQCPQQLNSLILLSWFSEFDPIRMPLKIGSFFFKSCTQSCQIALSSGDSGYGPQLSISSYMCLLRGMLVPILLYWMALFGWITRASSHVSCHTVYSIQFITSDAAVFPTQYLIQLLIIFLPVCQVILKITQNDTCAYLAV